MRSVRFLIALLAALTLATGAHAQWSKTRLVGPILHPVANAVNWQQGTFVNTQDYDCLQFGGGFSIGYIIGTFVSYYGDPNTNPQPRESATSITPVSLSRTWRRARASACNRG